MKNKIKITLGILLGIGIIYTSIALVSRTFFNDNKIILFIFIENFFLI